MAKHGTWRHGISAGAGSRFIHGGGASALAHTAVSCCTVSAARNIEEHGVALQNATAASCRDAVHELGEADTCRRS